MDTQGTDSSDPLKEGKFHLQKWLKRARIPYLNLKRQKIANCALIGIGSEWAKAGGATFGKSRPRLLQP
jgi:hypothetical protein